MVICNRAYESAKDLVLSKNSESGFTCMIPRGGREQLHWEEDLRPPGSPPPPPLSTRLKGLLALPTPQTLWSTAVRVLFSQ